ncbi:MAG: hypothetical protein M3281_05115, partial [Chloroflexota bacterium]|nr:hypothetical protein [Chloroflexota bacterium]
MNLRRAAGLGMIGLGVGVAASAVLGPLALRVIKFRVSPSAETQLVGGEVVSLAVVAPAAIAAGLLWLRGHRLAPALALAPCLYSLYLTTSLVLGVEYSRYPGNQRAVLPALLGDNRACGHLRCHGVVVVVAGGPARAGDRTEAGDGG